MLFFLGLVSLLSATPPAVSEDVSSLDKDHSLPFDPSREDRPVKAEKVILQGLNKITGKTFVVEAYVNQQINFGTLRIYPRKVYQSRPEDLPESYCCLEIWEDKLDKGETLIFSGWMVASSPNLMALEHPVYDIWVKGAKQSVKE